MIQDFIVKYFVEPQWLGRGYNLYNTLAYGVILIAALLLIAKLFARLNLKIDKKFYLATLPFILIGPTVRALTDAGLYNKFFIGGNTIKFSPMVSPGVYFMVFAPTLIFLLASIWIEAKWKIPYYKPLFGFGILTFAAFHANFYASVTIWRAIQSVRPAVNLSFQPVPLAMVLFFSGISIAIYAFVLKQLNLSFLLQKIPFLLVASHLYDASTTFVGMQFFGYIEKHVVPTFLIGIFGPAVMFLLKILVVPAVIWCLKDDKNILERDLIYYAIFVLGFAPATRNLLLMILGV